MIQLGLQRISRLLQRTSLSWPAVHVAGTNGKGSVCAYVSAMLKANNIKVGRFTSPHLVDRWDCISVDGKTIDEQIFRKTEFSVKARDKLLDLNATEFELLTATAFEIFSQEKIEIGVIEVGIGGRLDATNILSNLLVTVITKIGLDHQTLLGNTIEKIALEKAGIMKKDVPCIVDATNSPEVLHVFKEYARQVNAGPVVPVSPDLCTETREVWDLLPKDVYEAHQQINICLAFKAVKIALRGSLCSHQVFQQLLHTIPTAALPGRLQNISIETLTCRKTHVLLDGAHNIQSADVLGNYVDEKLRQSRRPVTWLMAFSKGKDIKGILPTLLRPEDNLLATTFGPVDGMPWVQPADLDQILHEANMLRILQLYEGVEDLFDALQRASGLSNEGPLIVAGSLYLVSDVLRLLSSHSQ